MANTITFDIDWNMPAGGLASDDDLFKTSKNKEQILPPRGIFAAFPGATPKYARNTGEEELDFREQMARLFIQISNYKDFVKSFTDPASRKIATVIGGTVSKTGVTNTNEGNGYIDFILQSVQHSFQEKNQIVETLADEHVAYFFGQAAPTFSYSGILVNTKQDDQAMNMLRLYRDMGRGSALALRKTLVSMRYDGLIVSGAMMNLSMGLNSDNEMAVPFSFNLLVKQVLLLPNPYAGLVQLEKPFNATSTENGYRPFDNSLPSDIGTKPVKPTLIPPVAPVPAASKATEPNATPGDPNSLKNMQKTATPLSLAEKAQQAAELKRATTQSVSSIGNKL